MTKKRRSQKPQRHFRVIAHGVRREPPRIPKLMQISLDLYLAEQERAAQATSTGSEQEARDESA